MLRDGAGDVLLRLDRRDRVGFAAEDERGALDPGEIGEQVERQAFAAGAEEVHEHLAGLYARLLRVRIGRGLRVVEGHRLRDPAHDELRLVVADGERVARHLGDLVAAGAAEQLDAAFDVRLPLRGGAGEDELAGMLGMARGVGDGDEAAERLPHDDRLLDLERAAELEHVVAPLRERPRLARLALAAAVAAMVDVDDLRDVGELRERRA